MALNVLGNADSPLRGAVGAPTLSGVLSLLPDGATVIVPTSSHRKVVLRTWAAEQPTRDVPHIVTMAGFLGSLAKRMLPREAKIIDDVEASVLLDLAMTQVKERFRPARLTIPTIVRWKQEQLTVDLVEHLYADAEERPPELRDIDRVVRVWRAYEGRKGETALDRGDVGFAVADHIAQTSPAPHGGSILVLGTHGLTTIDRTILHLLVRSEWDIGIWFMPHMDDDNRSTEVVPWLVAHGWDTVDTPSTDTSYRVVVRSWSSPREEVRRAIAAAKELIGKGMKMSELAIVAPPSGSYDALLQDAALTSGLPLVITLNESLSVHRSATAVWAACQIVNGRWQRGDVERLVMSGQIRTTHDVGRLIEAAVQYRINGGDGPHDWLVRLDDARTRLAAAGDADDDKRLRAALAQLGTAQKAMLWLQQTLTPPGETLTARQFADWVAKDLILGLGMDVHDELPLTLERYCTLADRHALNHARFREHVERWWTIVQGTSITSWSGSPAGVAVLRPGEVRLRSLSALFVLGVIDGEMPTDAGDPIDEALMEGLRVHMDRENFSDLFHGVRDGATVVLSRPVNIDGDPTLTSPFFREAQEWETTVDLNEPSSIEALDTPQHRLLLDRADDLAYSGEGAPLMTDHQIGIDINALTPAARTKLEEHVGQALNPSRLDVMISCPYAYYGRRILGLDEPMTGDELLTPLERGTLMHGVAQAFFDRVRGFAVTDIKSIDDIQSAMIDLTQKPLAHWLPILHDVFQAQRAKLPAGYLYDEAEQRAFEGTEDRPGLLERWLTTEYTAQIDNASYPILFELDVQTDLIIEGGVVIPLRLRIDRVDAAIVDGDVKITVIDYKTTAKSTPTTPSIERGESTQMPLYLAAITAWFAERNVDVVAQDARYHTFGKSLRSVDDPTIKKHVLQFDEILKNVEPVVMELSEGRFPVRPNSKACAYCGLNEICRIESWGAVIEQKDI
jgi:RecB family exonuclease